jgi:hypothetical protein
MRLGHLKHWEKSTDDSNLPAAKHTSHHDGPEFRKPFSLGVFYKKLLKFIAADDQVCNNLLFAIENPCILLTHSL